MTDQNFIYYENLDIIGNDVGKINNKSVQEMKEMILFDENVVGFNTIGFVKNSFDDSKLEKIPVFKEKTN